MVKFPLVGTDGAGCVGSRGFPWTYGTVAESVRITGQPFTQRIGSRNVSRPMLWKFSRYGRTPRNTAHHSPDWVRTKSACPVDVTGKGRSARRCRCVRMGFPE